MAHFDISSCSRYMILDFVTIEHQQYCMVFDSGSIGNLQRNDNIQYINQQFFEDDRDNDDDRIQLISIQQINK
jgi:hypothetical protein